MYIKRLELSKFRCFEAVDVSFHYPGRPIPAGATPPLFPNVTLILGDNGAGKSSLLKAIAVGVLGTILPGSGFRPFQLVRSTSPGPADSDIRVSVEVTAQERFRGTEGYDYLFRALLKKRGSENYIEPQSTHLYAGEGPLPVPESLHEANLPSFFLCGYGPNRRSEESSFYDEAARTKAKAPRYQRVASLFEEGFTLVSFSPWLARMSSDGGKTNVHWDELVPLLEKLLCRTDIQWSRGIVDGEAEFVLAQDRTKVQFSALSDGYRAYLSWLGDLLKHLVEVTPKGSRIDETPGVISDLALLLKLKSTTSNVGKWDVILQKRCSDSQTYSSCATYFIELYDKHPDRALSLAGRALRELNRAEEAELLVKGELGSVE